MHINPTKEFVERRGIAPYPPPSVSHTVTTFNVAQYNPTLVGEDTPTRVTLNIEPVRKIQTKTLSLVGMD